MMHDNGWNVLLLVGIMLLVTWIIKKFIDRMKVKKSKVYWVERRLK